MTKYNNSSSSSNSNNFIVVNNTKILLYNITVKLKRNLNGGGIGCLGFSMEKLK